MTDPQTANEPTLTAETVRQIVQEELAMFRDSLATHETVEAAIAPVLSRVDAVENSLRDDQDRINRVEKRQDSQADFVSKLNDAIDRLSNAQNEMREETKQHIDGLVNQVRDVRQDMHSFRDAQTMMRDLQQQQAERQSAIEEQMQMLAASGKTTAKNVANAEASIQSLRDHVTDLFAPLYTAVMGDGEKPSMYSRIDEVERSLEPMRLWVVRRQAVENAFVEFVKKPRGFAMVVMAGLLFVQAFSNIDLTSFGDILISIFGGQ